MRILPILILLVSSMSLNGQEPCVIKNASFEEWIDLTDSFEVELDIAISEPIIFPDGWFSLFRLLDFALSSLIVDYLEGDTLDIPVFDAVVPYTPGANGTETGVRIAGDTLFSSADAVQLTDCQARPSTFSGYYKYEGQGNDTLTLAVVLIDSELVDTSEAIGYAYYTVVGQGDDISRSVDYVPFSVDFEYNSEGDPDSMVILVLNSRDQSNLTDTSFYVVDELVISGGSVSTADNNLEYTDALSPNPAQNYVRLQLDVPGSVNLELYNSLGTLVMSRKSLREGEDISIPHLTPGAYIAKLASGEQVFWQKLLVGR